MIILGLIAFVGFFLCCIGLFITVPISVIGQFVLAKQISDDGTVQ